MASHQRNKRRAMQWERFHQRYPKSGKYIVAAGKERIHLGHVLAHARCVEQGRYYPIGIRREPWTLRISRRGA
jgi:hypothetical protein